VRIAKPKDISLGEGRSKSTIKSALLRFFSLTGGLFRFFVVKYFLTDIVDEIEPLVTISVDVLILIRFPSIF